MDKGKINRDGTEDWEDAIDKNGKPKLKFPMSFRDEIDLNFDDMGEVEVKKPQLKKQHKAAKEVDISKRGRKNRGLFNRCLRKSAQKKIG